MSGLYDITLTTGPDGRPLAHRPDCPAVAEARASDQMVLTLFQCEKPLPRDVRVHSCMKERA